MTATELGDWYTYFGVTPFTYQLIDLEFAAPVRLTTHC